MVTLFVRWDLITSHISFLNSNLSENYLRGRKLLFEKQAKCEIYDIQLLTLKTDPFLQNAYISNCKTDFS